MKSTSVFYKCTINKTLSSYKKFKNIILVMMVCLELSPFLILTNKCVFSVLKDIKCCFV